MTIYNLRDAYSIAADATEFGPQAVDLCIEIYNFAQGNGKYDFSKLSDYDRENAAFDAWSKIEEKLAPLVIELEKRLATYGSDSRDIENSETESGSEVPDANGGESS